jgi:tetratricopeptide (TPR) repeat protein
MQVKETRRTDIEMKIASMGDYVKIGYLEGCLKNHLDYDTRKFVLVKLAGLYEQGKMFANAGEAMKNAAEINTTTQSKINDFMKATELFIRAGSYDFAEMCVKKAIAEASQVQQKEINLKVKEFYKTKARACLNEGKKKNAVTAYEKLIELKLDEKERAEITAKMAEIYENLGDMKGYFSLERRAKKAPQNTDGF